MRIGPWKRGMVVPLHVLYPGNENNRMWIEEVAHVTTDGATPFFFLGIKSINWLVVSGRVRELLSNLIDWAKELLLKKNLSLQSGQIVRPSST